MCAKVSDVTYILFFSTYITLGYTTSLSQFGVVDTVLAERMYQIECSNILVINFLIL